MYPKILLYAPIYIYNTNNVIIGGWGTVGLHHHRHQFSCKIIFCLYLQIAVTTFYKIAYTICQSYLCVRVPRINEVLIFNQNEERRVSKCFGTNVSVINSFAVKYLYSILQGALIIRKFQVLCY